MSSRLCDRTGGNPFFLKLLLSLLGNELESADSAPGSPLPKGVREAIRHQFGFLGAQCRELLSLASVMGREFSLPILAKAAGLDGAAVLELLGEAEEARIVMPDSQHAGQFRFSHALVAEALYDELGAVPRLRSHRLVAEALEHCHRSNLEPHLSELAHHFHSLAPAGDIARAIEYSRRAAAHDSAGYAYESAARHLANAIEATGLGTADGAAGADGGDGGAVLCDLLLQLGEAQSYGGDRQAGRESFARAAAVARRQDSPTRLASAALGFAAEEEAGVVVPERIALLEEALAAIDPEDSPLRIRVQGRLAHALYFGDQPERRVALGNEAVAMARRLGDPLSLAHALFNFHFVLVGLADAEERLAIAEEIVDIGGRLRDREVEGRGLVCCIEDELELGRIDRVDTAIASVAAIASQLRMSHLLWTNTNHRAMRALVEGDFEAAERHSADALRRGLRMSNDIAWQYFGIQTWVLRRDQGRLGELEADVRDLCARYPENTGWRSALAYFDADEGRLDDARRGLAHLVDDGLAAIRRDLNWLVSPALLSEVSFTLNDRTRAAILYDALLPMADRQVVIGLSMAVIDPVSRALGLCAATLGKADRAEHHLRDALASSEQMNAAPAVARIELDLARVLTASGRPEAALAAARRSLASSEELGMTRLEETARAVTQELQGVASLSLRRKR